MSRLFFIDETPVQHVNSGCDEAGVARFEWQRVDRIRDICPPESRMDRALAAAPGRHRQQNIVE